MSCFKIVFLINYRALMERLQVDPNMLEYLAGLFDVSGSITVEKNRDYRSKNTPKYSYNLRAEIERVQTETADTFRGILPGYDSNRPLPSGKTTSRWYVKARKAGLFLETLGPHFRLKAGHWQTIQEFMATTKARPAEDSERLKTEIRRLNNNPEISFALPITSPYLAGVFDGHGSIDIHSQENYLTLSVHTNHELFMAKIGSHLGTRAFADRSHGHIKTYIFVLYSTEAANFLARIQPYSIKYRKVIPLALNFQREWEPDKGKRRSREQKTIIESARELLIQARAQIGTSSFPVNS